MAAGVSAYQAKCAVVWPFAVASAALGELAKGPTSIETRDLQVTSDAKDVGTVRVSNGVATLAGAKGGSLTGLAQVVFTLLFINAARGAFAYHRMNQARPLANA